MRRALQLAQRALGRTSPNPMVGAILVKRGQTIGEGYHRQAGGPHAEVDALNQARRKGANPKGATLFVTLEPCSTHGRTPPCTDAIIDAGIKEVIYATKDPNPAHAGRGFQKLKRAGIKVTPGPLTAEANQLNAAFNHWICHKTPLVTVKAAMTLDGKIATSTGQSKWITGPEARREGMKLRQASDAIMVGINTIIADDPSLTYRPDVLNPRSRQSHDPTRPLRRIILDTNARCPLKSTVVTDQHAHLTTVVVSRSAPALRVTALSRYVDVLIAPGPKDRISLKPLLKRLGSQNVTSLLVEGGGEVNGSFLLTGLAQRVAFFYAPKIMGGQAAISGVAGKGVTRLEDALQLTDIAWRQLGPDLMLTGNCSNQD